VEPIRSPARSWPVDETYVERMLDQSLSYVRQSGGLDFPAPSQAGRCSRQGIVRLSENIPKEINGDPVAHVRQRFDKQDHRSSCSSVRCSASNIFGESQPQLPASTPAWSAALAPLSTSNFGRRFGSASNTRASVVACMSRWSPPPLFLIADDGVPRRQVHERIGATANSSLNTGL
jgi:hypothetical protein